MLTFGVYVTLSFVLLTGLHLMRTGDIVTDLNDLNTVFQLSYLDDFIAFKREAGEKATLHDVDMAFHQSEFERLRDDLDIARDETHLPDKPPGYDALNDLLVRVRLREWQPLSNRG